MLSMPYTSMMPIFTEDILHVGATGMGLLISASGVGAVIGSAILATMANRRRGFWLIISGGFMGLLLAAFAISQNWYLSLALLALVGVGLAGRMTLSTTLLQYYVEDAYRGRVMSVYLMEFGLTSVGVFAAGLIAASFGVQWAIGGFALTLALLSLLAMIFVPRLRNLD
jgi:MFS family permease